LTKRRRFPALVIVGEVLEQKCKSAHGIIKSTEKGIRGG